MARSVLDTACYAQASKVPPQRGLTVAVDEHAEALLLPVLGVHVPFHVMTVKSVTYSQVRPAATLACFRNPTLLLSKYLCPRGSPSKASVRF